MIEKQRMVENDFETFSIHAIPTLLKTEMIFGPSNFPILLSSCPILKYNIFGNRDSERAIIQLFD